MPPERIRVLIVDDSALVRRLLSDMLGDVPDIQVVGTAGDAFVAREQIKVLNPHVLTLDVEMPKMDGLTFLRNLMRLRPMPVVMISTLTEHGADVTLEALAIGAVDYLPKPKMDLAHTLVDYKEELATKIRTAAGARIAARGEPRPSAAPLNKSAGSPVNFLRTTEKIIGIGASTGGTEAIKEVLIEMPPDAPGIVIVQHIPKAFSGAFARRMDSLCRMTVCEAEDGQQILRGHVYIAPGDAHLMVCRDGARYRCRLDRGERVSGHIPSVDVLFRSLATEVRGNAMGVILTGMGKDGALCLKEMREVGCLTVAQDEASSLVWGMPGAAVHLDAADEVLALEKIHLRMLAFAAETGITRAPPVGPYSRVTGNE
jgi:two-component system chemotaxis response regulator CheB